jgi:hypothetical protein
MYNSTLTIHPVKLGTRLSGSYSEGATVIYKHDLANTQDIRDDATTLVAEDSSESTRVKEPLAALDKAGVPHSDQEMISQVIGHSRSKTGLGPRNYEHDATQAIAFVELFMGPSSALKINVVQEQISGGPRNKDKRPESRYQAHSSQAQNSDHAQSSEQARSSDQAQPMVQVQSSAQTQSLDHVQPSDQAQSSVANRLPSHETSVIVC